MQFGALTSKIKLNTPQKSMDVILFSKMQSHITPRNIINSQIP